MSADTNVHIDTFVQLIPVRHCGLINYGSRIAADDLRTLMDRRLAMTSIDSNGLSRRSLFALAGLSAGAALLPPRALGAESLMRSAAAAGAAKPRSIDREVNTSFASLKQINAGVLDIGYAETGPANGPAVILLHGWPYDVYSFVDVAPLLASVGYRVIVPYLRGFGTTRFLSNQTMRNAQQSAVSADIINLMDALKIDTAIFAGFDWGARAADIIAVLWPERCKALVSVSGYLIGSPAANKKPLPPKAEYAWWYQFYFATERGEAGYAEYRRDFAKLIWQLASPRWKFDDATFNRTAASFDNPDHVAIVIHNYRWRIGLANGEAKYDAWEKRLAEAPVITIPTITLEGDANGAPHPEPDAYRKKFAGNYESRIIGGGVGHNLPQEAPHAFAQAVMDVDRM
jgi:pimeloyl-ACP methyl ester carboxylesterase